jgi:hypothetical protein
MVGTYRRICVAGGLNDRSRHIVLGLRLGFCFGSGVLPVRPNHFDIDKYLDCVEGMITADEVERALWMIDNPPAWYRDNEPDRLKEIRHELHAALFTPAQYSAADREAESCDISQLKEYFPPRAEILFEVIKEYSQPNIMEVGPGSFWLPHSLLNKGLSFSYEYQSLGGPGFESAPRVEPSVNVFVAFELIEHLSNDMELYQAYLKFKKPARHVFLSTPLYTYGGGMKDWRGKQLGHLRAYTPKEFAQAARRIFKEFTFKDVIACEDGTMVLRGDRA